MRKVCVQCGKSFDAKLDRAKYCSSVCRAMHSKGVAPVAQLEAGDDLTSDGPQDGPLLVSVRERVEAASLSGSPDGLGAILLAQQLEASRDGAKTAALYRQFTAAMDRVDRLAPQRGAMDELRLRRDRKRSSA